MEIRVSIYEDSKSLRISLYHLINESTGFKCVGTYPDCGNLLEQIANDLPDVVLMDIQMPGINGIEAVGILREKYPEVKILMQTIFEDDEKIFNSILAGASGYILKTTSPARILDCIKECFEGGAPMSPVVATKVLKMFAQNSKKIPAGNFNLSDREKEILSNLVEGMSYKMIGQALFISLDTVRSHIKNIYEKLHVHSKGEAVAKAINNRIV